MQLPDPSTKKTDDDRDCCCSSPSGPSKVKTLDSQAELDKLIASGDQIGEFSSDDGYLSLSPWVLSKTHANPFWIWSNSLLLVCKFTATWCKPCHRIQPIYEGISSGYNENSNIHFLTIDVDDFADISSDYKVAMMPTFLVLQGSDIKATYRGSDDAALRTFIKENVGN